MYLCTAKTVAIATKFAARCKFKIKYYDYRQKRIHQSVDAEKMEWKGENHHGHSSLWQILLAKYPLQTKADGGEY